MKHAIVTGGAGFIGSHLVDRLLESGWRVTAVDNFDPFYDPELKRRNLAPHLENERFRLVEADIRDLIVLRHKLRGRYNVIVHLAAKAGVRPSIEDPTGYQTVNVVGTQNLLELARVLEVEQFIFASSSSVYGANPRAPWKEDDCVLEPISPYASTKVSGELLGHVYSHLFGIRFLALRFFTVYGPRQRPDLAIHKFARLMLEGLPIPFFGDGSTRRDYTYVDDVVSGVVRAMSYTASSYEVLNLGNDRTVRLDEMVHALERALGIKAKLERLPAQPGDVPQTWADITKAQKLIGYKPETPFEQGIVRFVEWLRGAQRT